MIDTTIEEGSQSFEFDDTWQVWRYDGDESPFHGVSTGTQPMEQGQHGCRACDFMGVRERAAYFFEVKDFRGYRIENKTRIESDDLPAEVAIKTRDSIAGVIAGCRNCVNAPSYKSFADLLCRADRDVWVVLCVEHDLAKKPLSWKAQLNVLTQSLKQRCRWLKARVLVISKSCDVLPVPGLQINNLPGAGGKGRHS